MRGYRELLADTRALSFGTAMVEIEIKLKTLLSLQLSSWNLNVQYKKVGDV